MLTHSTPYDCSEALSNQILKRPFALLLISYTLSKSSFTSSLVSYGHTVVVPELVVFVVCFTTPLFSQQTRPCDYEPYGLVI